MLPFNFLPRGKAREAPHSRTHSRTHSRAEVYAPSLRQAPCSTAQRLWFWLMAPAPLAASPPLNRQPPVRQEFLAALKDVPLAQALRLSERIANARSLRELWHLRLPVYGEVAMARTQSEAESRLSHLNRHFPMRAPHGGLAGQRP